MQMHKPGLFLQRIQAIRQRNHRNDSAGASSRRSQLSPTRANKTCWTLASTSLSGVFPHLQERDTAIPALDLHRAALGKARIASYKSTIIQQLLFLRIHPIIASDLRGLTKGGLSSTLSSTDNPSLQCSCLLL